MQLQIFSIRLFSIWTLAFHCHNSDILVTPPTDTKIPSEDTRRSMALFITVGCLPISLWLWYMVAPAVNAYATNCVAAGRSTRSFVAAYGPGIASIVAGFCIVWFNVVLWDAQLYKITYHISPHVPDLWLHAANSDVRPFKLFSRDNRQQTSVTSIGRGTGRSATGADLNSIMWHANSVGAQWATFDQDDGNFRLRHGIGMKATGNRAT